jgi:hypothetical protein
MAMGAGIERGSVTALGVLTVVCAARTERDPALRLEDPIAPRLIRWRDGRFATARAPGLNPLIRRSVERTLPGNYG